MSELELVVKFPEPQAWQYPVAELLYVRFGQAVCGQALSSVPILEDSVQNLPIGHVTQASAVNAPSAEENRPMVQTMQSDALSASGPVTLMNLPGGQVLQLADPGAAYAPVGQLMQSDALSASGPVAVMNLPAGQVLQLADPGAAYCPSAHGSHVSSDATL
jgi:hypothetical protein